MLKKIPNPSTCKLGEGEACCAYLVVGNDDFECVKDQDNGLIAARLKAGTMNAKGEGNWKGCPRKEK